MVICCVIMPVKAETEEKEHKSPVLESALVAPELEKKPVYDHCGAASAALTGDTVTFDAENGAFNVVTAAGTQMTISVPFGAYCIPNDGWHLKYRPVALGSRKTPNTGPAGIGGYLCYGVISVKLPPRGPWPAGNPWYR